MKRIVCFTVVLASIFICGCGIIDHFTGGGGRNREFSPQTSATTQTSSVSQIPGSPEASGGAFSIKAANLLAEGQAPTEQFKTIPIPAGAEYLKPTANEYFTCEAKSVVAEKENGNVVAIFFLKDKMNGAPMAVQAEISRGIWSDYQRCGTVYFNGNPQGHLEFQNSYIEKGGESYPFWISKGVVAKL